MNRLICQALVVALLGWLIFNSYQTVQYVFADYSSVPIFDYWREPQLWPLYKTFHWSPLWLQHNEHRIIFPEILYIIDMFVLHGRMCLPIVLSGLFYVGIWGVVVWAAYSKQTMEIMLRTIALLLAGVVMAWKGCSTVIATPFQIQFTLLQFMCALALGALAKLAETGRSVFLGLIIAAATIGTYSSGNGMLVWPVLIAGGLVLRISGRQMLILTGAAVVTIGAYFVGYQFLPSHMSVNIRHPVQALEFLCSYMSMPFGAAGTVRSGINNGAVSLILMGVCLGLAWGRGLLQTRLGVVIFGSYLFTVLSAALATAGRLDLSDQDFAAAKAWRYITMPTVGWALLAVALIWMMAERASRSWALAASLLITVFFGLGLANASKAVETTRESFGDAQIVATMLQNNVFDPAAVKSIFPVPDSVRAELQVLMHDHKSVYALGNDKWIGQDIRRLMPKATAVRGQITHVYPFPGGMRILGWAEDAWLSGDHAVLFVDGNQKIVGFGRRPQAGFPPLFTSWNTPRSSAFVGYVATHKAMGPLSVYVRSSNGMVVQHLNGGIPVPSFTVVESADDRAPLPGVVWQPEANWTLRGYTVTPDNGPAPPGDIYASWSGLDTKTGSFHTQPFATPPNHCLVLPVLTGGSSFGQSVEVDDADSRLPIAQIPPADSATWERWRIIIPEASRNLQITAVDEGTAMYQWVAVANPQSCP